jgi:hypothetical protein
MPHEQVCASQHCELSLYGYTASKDKRGSIMTYKLSLVAAWVIGIAVNLIIGACIVGIAWALWLAMTVQIPAW